MQLGRFNDKEHFYIFMISFYPFLTFIPLFSLLFSAIHLYVGHIKLMQIRPSSTKQNFVNFCSLKSGPIWEAMVIKLFLLKFVWGQILTGLLYGFQSHKHHMSFYTW